MGHSPELLAQVKAEYKIAVKHLGVKAYADLHGMTVPQMKEVAKEAGSTVAVKWSALSDPVLRGLFDAFIAGGEVASRFASRHGYSVGGMSAAIRDRWPDEWDAVTAAKRPSHSNLYKMGRSFERRIRLQLIAAGYFVVRSAGSKTKVDLTAIKDGEILLIQCKRSGALPPDEWNGLMDVAAQTHGLPILVENPHAGTTNWWRVLTRKEGRGTGKKEAFTPPPMLVELDFDQLDVELDEQDAEVAKPER